MSSQDAAKRGSWPGQDMKFGIEQYDLVCAVCAHVSFIHAFRSEMVRIDLSSEQRMKKKNVAANH